MSKIKETFKNIKLKNKKAFSVFLMSGYPDSETFLDLLKLCSDTGVDFIEVGMPFSDPSADGPTVKQAGTIALENGTTVKDTIESIQKFRKYDNKTPIVWMGYFNSIFNYGVNHFLNDIENGGFDGLLIVDLPIEEINRLEKIKEKNLDFITLVTPTTTKERLPLILKKASGFIYFISITGITGTKEAEEDKIKEQVKYIQSQTNLPIIVGFGIKDPQKAKQINSFADGSIVGSALIEKISKHINKDREILDRKALIMNIKQILKDFTEQ